MINQADLVNLELREDNPYSLGEIFTFDEGDVVLDRLPIIHNKSTRDRYFTVIDGDNLNDIAFQAYGNSKYWWIIADINDIFNPFDLPTGTTLLIPDLYNILANV